jgi:hypothetical protein
VSNHEEVESTFSGGPVVPEGLIEVEEFNPFDLLDDRTNDELNIVLGQLATNRTSNQMHRDRHKILP